MRELQILILKYNNKFIRKRINRCFFSEIKFSGGLLFAKSFGGTGDDGATDVKIDANGNLLMTGYFSETVDFDPSNGTTNLSSLGFEDAFTLKLNNLVI